MTCKIYQFVKKHELQLQPVENRLAHKIVKNLSNKSYQPINNQAFNKTLKTFNA